MTFNSRVASRPATAMTSICVSQPAIHSAALGLEAVLSIDGGCRACCARRSVGSGGEMRYRRHQPDLQRAIMPMQSCAPLNFEVGASGRSVLWDHCLVGHSGAMRSIEPG